MSVVQTVPTLATIQDSWELYLSMFEEKCQARTAHQCPVLKRYSATAAAFRSGYGQ